MISAQAVWWSKAIAIIIMATLASAWVYNFIFAPLVEGRWLWVATFVAATLFWLAVRSAAQHKAHSVDYRRNGL